MCTLVIYFLGTLLCRSSNLPLTAPLTKRNFLNGVCILFECLKRRLDNEFGGFYMNYAIDFNMNLLNYG